MKSVNKGRTSEEPLGEYLVPRLPWKQISEAHHWKCWKVGLPERDGGELTDRQRHRRRRQEIYYRLAKAQGWRSWGLVGHRTDSVISIRYIYACEPLVLIQRLHGNLAVWGCEWAVRLHGPQAWMSHSTWTHRQACAVEETAKLSEEEGGKTVGISFTGCEIPPRTSCGSGPCDTLVWHLVADQLPDHLCPGTSHHWPPSLLKLNSKLQVSHCIS